MVGDTQSRFEVRCLFELTTLKYLKRSIQMRSTALMCNLNLLYISYSTRYKAGRYRTERQLVP